MNNIITTEATMYLVSDNEKPCTVCGKPTNQIEIHYESRVCSDDCCKKKDEEYTEYLRRMELHD